MAPFNSSAAFDAAFKAPQQAQSRQLHSNHAWASEFGGAGLQNGHSQRGSPQSHSPQPFIDSQRQHVPEPQSHYSHGAALFQPRFANRPAAPSSFGGQHSLASPSSSQQHGDAFAQLDREFQLYFCLVQPDHLSSQLR